MKLLSILFFLSLSFHAFAASLYGVELKTANRDQLTSAVKSSGLKNVKGAIKAPFYDQYKSDGAISASSILYLGFESKTQAFAFAEYEFIGLSQNDMLSILELRYGKPKVTKASFVSDQSYTWISGETTIVLYQDWSAYRTRLVYFNSPALQKLKQERGQSMKNLNIVNLMDQAY